MASRNVETYRAGQPEGLRGDDQAIRRRLSPGPITRRVGRSGRPRSSRTTSWQGGSGPPATSESPTPRYIDAGQTVVCALTIAGTQDGPLGPLPATGKEFTLAALRDVALRLERACGRWGPLLRPGRAAHAVGPDAAADRSIGGFVSRLRWDLRRILPPQSRLFQPRRECGGMQGVSSQ
jgi:hypothetical protein